MHTEKEAQQAVGQSGRRKNKTAAFFARWIIEKNKQKYFTSNEVSLFYQPESP